MVSHCSPNIWQMKTISFGTVSDKTRSCLRQHSCCSNSRSERGGLKTACFDIHCGLGCKRQLQVVLLKSCFPGCNAYYTCSAKYSLALPNPGLPLRSPSKEFTYVACKASVTVLDVHTMAGGEMFKPDLGSHLEKQLRKSQIWILISGLWDYIAMYTPNTVIS